MILLLLPLLLFDGIFLMGLTSSKRYVLASTYFSVTRIIAVVLLTLYYFHYLVNLTSATSQGAFIPCVSIAYILLTALTAFASLYGKVRSKLSFVTLCVSIIGLIACAVLYFGIGPNVNNPGSTITGPIVHSRQDQQSARDLELIDGCIALDITANNKLPPTMQAAINKYGGSSPQSCTAGEDVSNRLGNYTYTPLNGLNYKLCATFHGSASEPSSIGNSSQADNHGKGYQCFTYDQYGQ